MSDIKQARREREELIEKGIEKSRLKEKVVKEDLKHLTNKVAELMEERRLTLKDISDNELLLGNIKQEITQAQLDLWAVKKEDSTLRKSLEEQTKISIDKEKKLEQEYHGKLEELTERRDNLDKTAELLLEQQKRVNSMHNELDKKLEYLDAKQRQIDAGTVEFKEATVKAHEQETLTLEAEKKLLGVGEKIKYTETKLQLMQEKLSKEQSLVKKQKENYENKLRNIEDRELEVKLREATLNKKEIRLTKLSELHDLES